MCSIACAIACCSNSSWDIPQIWFFLCSFSFLCHRETYSGSNFLLILSSYLFLPLTILCIDHKTFLWLSFIFIVILFTLFHAFSFCFFLVIVYLFIYFFIIIVVCFFTYINIFHSICGLTFIFGPKMNPIIIFPTVKIATSLWLIDFCIIWWQPSDNFSWNINFILTKHQ